MVVRRVLLVLTVIMAMLLLMTLGILPGFYGEKEEGCVKKGIPIFVATFDGVITSSERVTTEDMTIKAQRGQGILEKSFYQLSGRQFVGADDVIWGGPCR